VVSPVLADDQTKVRRLRRVEYDRLVEAGVFAGERLELIRGVIVEMPPQDARHASAVQRLAEILHERIARRASIRTRLPLALDEDSEPEPDIVIAPRGDYREEHPKSALLIIEVALPRLDFDRVTKASIYAAAGIEEYWLVNLVDGRVEAHRKPAAGSYTQLTTYAVGDTIRIGAFPDVEIAVSDIL
jgi:Uma2 family endonuclease